MRTPSTTPAQRRALCIGAVVSVLASYGVAGPAPASAGSITGSSFEIDTDANLVVDGLSTLDWLSGSALRPGVEVQDDEPSGGSDNSFTQGTKEDDTTPTVDTGSIPPSKSDLKHFGVFVEKYASANFVNVFWSRVQDPSGTTNIDFEFNQSGLRANNPAAAPQVIPVRTAGDILITYALTNGGTQAIIRKRTWTGTQWSAPSTFNANQALGTINTTAIPAAASGGLGTFDPRTFGEASINMAALVPDQTTCMTFGSVYVKSRSSASFTSELKDFIAPEPVSISNCGGVRIHKTDDEGVALPGAGFTLYRDVDPVGGSTRGAEDTASAGSCLTDSAGDCSISDVRIGKYWLVETTVPAGHDPVVDTYVSITTGDQVVSLSLVDPIQYGTLVVVKEAVPNDAQDFAFSLDGQGFSLDDDPSSTLSRSRSFQVVAGTHTLVEGALPIGWVNTALQCVDPTSNSTVDLAARTATARVAKGETVTCTYTNTYSPGVPPLATQATESVANTSWHDLATLTGDGVHPVTGIVTFHVCAPLPVATACTAGGTQVGAPATVVAAGGSSYTASTTVPWTPPAAGWSCFRATFTSSSPFYENASHTNATTECFRKSLAPLSVFTTAIPAFGRAYTWTIAKDVDRTRVEIAEADAADFHYTVTAAHTLVDSAWTVAGRMTVTNPNPVAFTGVTVAHAVDNGSVSCTLPDLTDLRVPANGSVPLDYSCTYASAPNPLAGTVTATATWDAAAFFTSAASAVGTASADFTDAAPSTTDEQVTVTDTVAGSLGTVNALTDPNPRVFTYSVTRSGVGGTCTDYGNTASLVTNDTATGDRASRSVTLCVGRPLLTSSAVTASFDRAYSWLIDKAVDQTTVTVSNGESATFDYTVTVTPAGLVDSGYAMSGTATIVNPNDWQSVLADVTVASDVGGGVACTVPGGDDVLLAPSASVTLGYTCAFTGAPAVVGTAAATATWSAALAHTAAGSSSASTPVSFTLVGTTDRVITVIDDKTDPANPVTLGSWSYDDGPHAFTYSLTKEGVDSSCVDFTNTALIVETGQSDVQDVTLCSTFTGGGGGPVVTPPQGGGLPFTGDLLLLLLRTSAALLAAGLLLTMVSRRRRA